MLHNSLVFAYIIMLFYFNNNNNIIMIIYFSISFVFLSYLKVKKKMNIKQ